MKKFLAFAAAGVLALSMAGCGNKDNEPTTPEPTNTATEGETETEPEAEPEPEPVEVTAEDFDYVHAGVGVSVPEDFKVEEYSGGTSIIYTGSMPATSKGSIQFEVKTISVDENNDFYGHGYEKADSVDMEAEDIEPFEAGGHHWFGYRFQVMLFGSYWHYVNLATEEKNSQGQNLSVLLKEGQGDEEWYALDSEEVQYILSNMDFVEEAE